MSKYKYYMHPCTECGDDAVMMSKETSCPQCNSTRIRVIPNPSYNGKDSNN